MAYQWMFGGMSRQCLNQVEFLIASALYAEQEEMLMVADPKVGSSGSASFSIFRVSFPISQRPSYMFFRKEAMNILRIKMLDNLFD